MLIIIYTKQWIFNKDKYYEQPKCKYTIRSTDSEKFKVEVLDKILSKFDRNQITFKEKTINVVEI